jgi:hypothetical protein
MSAIDLYWLPLGAGGHSMRLNGLVFEAIAARLQPSRSLRSLPLGARGVRIGGRFVIEQAPAWGMSDERGVVAEGPVGTRALGLFRLFGYEVRRWRDGVIPDVAESVESPQAPERKTPNARGGCSSWWTKCRHRVGPRRVRRRRDVELELDHLLADRSDQP